jgi:hypothetical protein
MQLYFVCWVPLQCPFWQKNTAPSWFQASQSSNGKVFPLCASYASTGQNRFLLGRMEHVRNTSIIISLDSNDSICPSYSGALETILGKRLTPLATLYHMLPFKQANDRRARREHKKNTTGHITRHFPGVFGSNCLLITFGSMIRWTCIYISLRISIHICVWIRVLMYLSSQISG